MSSARLVSVGMAAASNEPMHFIATNGSPRASGQQTSKRLLDMIVWVWEGAQVMEHRQETCPQTISTTSDSGHAVNGATHRKSAGFSDAVDHDNCSVCTRRSNRRFCARGR
jgi:hypothetical protein